MSKMIHQVAISSHNLKDYTPPNKDSIVKYFNNYQHIVWDYQKIKAFIIKNKDIYVLDAINNVKANAFKADIARYYILYKLGGWYSDLNNFFISSPPENDHKLIFFRDAQHLTNTSWAVQNSLFYANAEHKVLKAAIDRCIENVFNRYYGGHPLAVTGPILFGSTIASFGLEKDSNYLIGDLRKNNEPGFYLDKELFSKYKPNSLAAANSGVPGGNNYELLWKNGELY